MPTMGPISAAPGDLVALIAVLIALVPIVVVDLRSRRIPDAVVIPALAVVLSARVGWGSGPAWAVAAWTAIACAVLLVPALVRPDGMGMGDVKLAALIGAALGAWAIAAIVVALVAGAVVGALGAVARGRSVRGATIAFAPFLAAGALVVGIPAAFLH